MRLVKLLGSAINRLVKCAWDFRCTQNNKLFSVVSQKRARRYEKDLAETRELRKKEQKIYFL